MSKSTLKLLVILLISIFICGCQDMNSHIDNFESDMHARISMNQQEVDKLHAAGLLSDESAKSLKDALADQEKRLLGMTTSTLSRHTVQSTGDISGYIKASSNPEGMSVISEDNAAMQELMNNLDYEVYVIKKDPLGNGQEENALVTLDTIAMAVKEAKETGDSSILEKYFVPTGKKVWDTSKEENKIWKETEDNPAATPNLLSSSNRLGLDYVGVKVVVYTVENEDGTISEIVEQVSLLQVRLIEFNREAIARLVRADGVNQDMYVIVDNKCYLMQYPVSYIKGFETEDGKSYTAVYEDSDLMVNILTNEIMYKDGRVCLAGDNENVLSVLANNTSTYKDIGRASFVVDGITGKEPEVGYLKTGDTLQNKDGYGRIVLRDYLELLYMPGIVDNENLVALGRRVRITKMKGTGNEVIGIFVDKNGNEVTNSVRIKISDFMDVTEGLDARKKTKLKLDGEVVEETSGTAIDVGDTPVTSVNTAGEAHDRLLETQYNSSIVTSTRFPDTVVATGDTISLLGTDEDSDTAEKVKHFFYGMAVDIDPFASNLVSGWVAIEGEATETGNLDWWNHWLSSSTYRYRIDRDAVMNYLMGNYALEMRDNNYVVLDIPTIVEIQDRYNEQERQLEAGLITTIFTILGFVVIGYGSIILGAWAYDVNIVAGPRLLGFLSFGKWIAIGDEEMLPYMNTGGKHYMNFSSVLKTSIMMIAMGVLLIMVDIMQIIGIIISIFGTFAQALGNVIQGI